MSVGDTDWWAKMLAEPWDSGISGLLRQIGGRRSSHVYEVPGFGLLAGLWTSRSDTPNYAVDNVEHELMLEGGGAYLLTDGHEIRQLPAAELDTLREMDWVKFFLVDRDDAWNAARTFDLRSLVQASV